MIDGAKFFYEADEVLHEVATTQMPAIQQAAEIMASVLRSGGVMHSFGTGHSRTFSMEIAGRAGGLVPVNAMNIKDLALRGEWPPEQILDPMLERDPSIAREVWALHRVDPCDGFIIASNSGANGAIVEMAQLAQNEGHPLIAVTSLEHTNKVSSNHPSGKRLFEVADVVIDNCGPYGDALLNLPGGSAMCAVSSISAALVGQMIVAETARALLEAGEKLPVLISVNVPGGEEHNDQLQRRYEGRVSQSEA